MKHTIGLSFLSGLCIGLGIGVYMLTKSHMKRG